MSRVFVVQEPLHRSPRTGDVQRIVDISPAERFGTLVYLLDWSDNKFDSPRDIIRKLRERLADYCDDDYLLMSGSPTAFGIAAMVAGEYNDGRVRFLHWDKQLPRHNGRGYGDYKCVEIDLNGQPV